VLLPELARIVIAGAATVVLGVAAVSDVRLRRIPNWTVLALIALYALLAFDVGGAGLTSSLMAAALALVVSAALYALGFIGAGDSKLITAVALFAGLGNLPLLAVGTTLTGGLIAAASLVARPARGMAMLAMRGRGDWGRGIPYGVAIAVGGALVIWATTTNIPTAFG
jgi:prepilin peptidase CpaA